MYVGFEAVECAQDIYQHSSDKIAVASRNAAVQVILINSPSGKELVESDKFNIARPLGGGPTDRGLAAVPGREEDFKTSISTAITYATALNCSRYKINIVQMMAGPVYLSAVESVVTSVLL